METGVADRSRGWVAIALLVWLLAALVMVVINRDAIAALNLPDTDDAQRLVEVRDWLGGQDWGDVDQHRMNPPAGAVMHWSRVVDLPIAALIIAAKPIVGLAAAERFAAAVAPLLALMFALLMTGLAASRLAGRQATVFAMLFFVACSQVMPMFAPLRIDHHGWQIALVLGVVAFLSDPRQRYVSGLAAGSAAAIAMMIGLEMLPHITVASAVLVFGWCVRPSLGAMLKGYGTALLIGTIALYPAFVPTVRWTVAACDAMSPVYLAAFAPAGLIALVLPQIRPLDTIRRRMAAAAIAYGLAGAVVIVSFPQCAAGPLAALDPAFLPVLSRISEARSLFSYLGDKPATVAFLGLYPFVGIACAAYLLRSADPTRQFGWFLVLSVLIASTLLMFVQMRAATGPNAIACIAAGAATVRLLPWARSIPSLLPRLLATAAVLVAMTSALPTFVALGVAKATGTEDDEEGSALASCTSAETLAPVAKLPRGIILDVFDMGPALLVHTGHTVVAGPYHRSASMISDAVRVWRAGDVEAYAIAARYGATYLLGCAGSNDLDAAKMEAPKGLWARLEAGKVPSWLTPLPLPEGSPLKLYRIKGRS